MSVPSSTTVLEVVTDLWSPGTPFTTSEVAEEFSSPQGNIHDRLAELADDGLLLMKRVGPNSHVWWRPIEPGQVRSEDLEKKRSQVRSNPVFNSEMVGVIVWGDDLTIQDANDAFLDMVGLDYEEALGTSWKDLTPGEFYQASERHIKEVEESGSGLPYEKQYFHSDGSRWWGIFESRQLNDSEKVEYVVEITDRKEYEQELTQANKQLREFKLAVDAAGHAIYMTDSDGEITYANQAFEDITGYSPADVIGENPRILKSGEMSESYYEELWESVTSGEIWVEEVINRRKNGAIYHARQTIAPVTNEARDIHGYVAIQTDITEQKEREEQLAMYKRAIEGAEELITALDSEYRYLFANEAYRRFHGLDPEEFTGVRFREVISEEEFETAKPYVERAFDGETVSYRMTRNSEDGTGRNLSVEYSPLRDEAGSIWAIVATMRDITDLVERENHLRSIDRMLRHNLRSELNVVLGRASMIEQEGVPEVAAHAEAITEAGNRLLDQATKEREIVQILTEPPKPTALDLTQRIRSITKRLQEEYPEAMFELDLPAELVISTISEFDQALEELLENAIVHAADEPSEVRIVVTEHEDGIELEIVDSNPPIPSEERAVLSGESQIDVLTHTSGMGLWLVKRSVSRANGKLSFESREPTGNRISIALPTRETSLLFSGSAL